VITEHPKKGILLICAAVFLFASSDALSKYLTNFYPVVMVLWVRYVVHVVLILAALRPPSLKTLITTQNPKLQIIRGLCMANTNLMFISRSRVREWAIKNHGSYTAIRGDLLRSGALKDANYRAGVTLEHLERISFAAP
jgi:hypothetical protein